MSTAAESVLVTGASGFIGGACVEEFLKRDWRVTVLVHRHVSEKLRALQDAGSLEIVRASIADRAGLLKTLTEHVNARRDGLKAVVNCAGRASDVGRERAFREINCEGVRNLIYCIQALPIERLVQISTTDVYGLCDFDQADESTPLNGARGNPYPRYKVLAERAIVEELPPERYVILRPAAVWGPGDTTILPRVIRYLRSTPRVFHFGKWKGANRWPLAWVGNVARMSWLASWCEVAGGQAYNILDRERTSIDEYYRIVAAIYCPERKTIKRLTLPLWTGLLTGALSTALSNMLNLAHPLFEPSMYGLHSVTHNLDFDGSKAEALLAENGLQPVTREEQLAELRREAKTRNSEDAALTDM